MSFRVLLLSKAVKSLEKLQASIRERIKDALKDLEQTLERGDQLKSSQFSRLRIGDYRAIYEIDRSQSKIVVLYIGHKKDVYDDFSRLL